MRRTPIESSRWGMSRSASLMTRAWRNRLDERITELERLRDTLTGCIGCGCLSLRTCTLLNQADHITSNGPGARYLLGDSDDD